MGVRRAIGGRPGPYEQSPHFEGGVFHNSLPGRVVDPDERGSMLRDMVGRRRTAPPAIPVTTPELGPSADECAATWLGHSTVLVEIGGHWVLTDPVFSERVSPSATVGPRRLHPVPLGPSDLPRLDAVLISHDHYDHLDMASIDALARTGVPFVVPLGVGVHLSAWGVPADQIVELDWGQTHLVGDLELGCAEARHFSGRLFSRNKTLWAAWTLASGGHTVLFGGDTGYTPAFKELADIHDGFDLTLLPIGAYDRRWADVHLDPAEAVQTHLDVRGEILLPIHWATFTLAFHDWDEPVEWLCREASERGVRLALPQPGQRWQAGQDLTEPWWPRARA